MIVVADTGPLRYLLEINCSDVLPRLYGSVLTTPSVMNDLRLPHFPQVVQAWAQSPPEWLQVRPPTALSFLDLLDLGEASALSLAIELHAELILIDERDGTRIARGQQPPLQTLGTLGVIRDAAVRDLLDFEQAITRLQTRTKFWSTPDLIEYTRSRYLALRDELRRPYPGATQPRSSQE